MNLAALRAWLAADQDFDTGVALYAQVGTSATFKRLFALGATPYSRQVLQRELAALAGHAEQRVQVALAGPAHREHGVQVILAGDGHREHGVRPTLVEVGAQVPVSAAPAPATEQGAGLLAELARQLKGVRDERSHLHPQLTAKGLRKKDRLALCGQIVALTYQEVALLSQQAHVRQHGRLPGPVPVAEVTDPGELRRRLTNARALRSKLKRNPARATDLVRVQAAIDLLTQQLAS